MLRNGIFVTGTDTGVGKTQVTAGLAAVLLKREALKGKTAVLFSAVPRQGNEQVIRERAPKQENEQVIRERALRQGNEQVIRERAPKQENEQIIRDPRQMAVQLWKPVQSGATLGSPEADSYRLLHGSGLPMREADIATHTFTAPVAPWLAAREAGTPLIYRDLVAEGRRRLQQGGCLLVEGAGGLLVPLAERQRMADLAADLKLPLLIIARAGLGTVNHTLLTVAYARQVGLEVLGVILNHSEGEALNHGAGNLDAGSRLISETRLDEAAEMAANNAMMIEQFGGVPVLGVLPWLAQAGSEEADWAVWRLQWMAEIERNVRLDVFYQDALND